MHHLFSSWHFIAARCWPTSEKIFGAQDSKHARWNFETSTIWFHILVANAGKFVQKVGLGNAKAAIICFPFHCCATT